jgi:NAD(P)-dependent dehydrogenase (short-subunit alcohol dehydrogenase family)
VASILVTGSTDGVGRNTAEALLAEGHRVAVHARTTARLANIQHLLERGAESVLGDLGDLDQVHGLVEQVNALGRFDAVVHNAGVMQGPVLTVNATAPYLMTALIPASRHIYLSSSMHRGGQSDLTGIDWTGQRATRSYSDAKLYVTALMAAIARHRPDVLAHAVDPGWVPTKMGGAGASDDLALAHVTQVWLASTHDPEALISGRYWHHLRTEKPHPAADNETFQDELLASVAEQTGVQIPGATPDRAARP